MCFTDAWIFKKLEDSISPQFGGNNYVTFGSFLIATKQGITSEKLEAMTNFLSCYGCFMLSTNKGELRKSADELRNEDTFDIEVNKIFIPIQTTLLSYVHQNGQVKSRL